MRLVRRHPPRGFTLTEMAVVMVIVALLIGGMLIPLTTQQDVKQRQDAEKALAEIREALMGYAVINGRLPCPADRSIANGVANAGVEATAGSGTTLTCACTAAASGIAQSGGVACTSTAVGGVLPWATLGLPETDPWASRYTYHVTAMYARGIDSNQTLFGAGCSPSQAPTQAAFALCTPGVITVLAAAGGVTVVNGLPALVVSHAKNTAGAWLTSGSQVAGAAGDELENANTDTNFVSNTTIDDIVVSVAPSVLMSRMLTAAKLP